MNSVAQSFCAIKCCTFDGENSSAGSVIKNNFYLAQIAHKRLRIGVLCA